MELYENEFVAKNCMRVFMNCGNANVPEGCLCGCGINRESGHPSSSLFSLEAQQKNYYNKQMYRFFVRKSHLEGFKNKMRERDI